MTQIHGIHHTRLTELACNAFSDEGSTESFIAGTVSSHLESMKRRATIKEKPPSSDAHLLCSTMVDVPFSSGKLSDYELINGCVRATGIERTSMTNAYECAAWGYGLRHLGSCQPEARNILVTIFDINVLGLEFWKRSNHWGHSGFGITTIALERGAGNDDLQVGHCGSGNNLVEFGRATRSAAGDTFGGRVALPFFSDDMGQPLRRILSNYDLLPDRHSQMGHVFGADPWLAILLEAQQRKIAAGGENILLGSLAFRGYYCFLEASLPETFTGSYNDHH